MGAGIGRGGAAALEHGAGLPAGDAHRVSLAARIGDPTADLPTTARRVSSPHPGLYVDHASERCSMIRLKDRRQSNRSRTAATHNDPFGSLRCFARPMAVSSSSPVSPAALTSQTGTDRHLLKASAHDGTAPLALVRGMDTPHLITNGRGSSGVGFGRGGGAGGGCRTGCRCWWRSRGGCGLRAESQ